MAKSKPRYLPLGSISCGTMREEDLIPTFLYEAKHLRLSKADRKMVREIDQRYAAATDSDSEQDEAPNTYFADTATDDLSDLFDLLNNYAPDYCYFGAPEGFDGALYGVWPMSELLTDTSQGGYDGYVFRCGDHHPSEYGDPANGDIDEPIDLAYSHALRVNDHGNATLYRRVSRRNQWTEVWSIV